jgi:hypothetical protein
MYGDPYAAEWRTKARVEDALGEAEAARLVRHAARQEGRLGNRRPWGSVLERLVSWLGASPTPGPISGEYMFAGNDLKL